MANFKDVFNSMENGELIERVALLEKELESKSTSKFQKLKWTGKPEQFGFIFLELAQKGFIEIPGTNGEASYSKFAQSCFDLFEFENETTLENLKRTMNPSKNALSESNRQKFQIPNKDDIS